MSNFVQAIKGSYSLHEGYGVVYQSKAAALEKLFFRRTRPVLSLGTLLTLWATEELAIFKNLEVSWQI